MLTRPKTSVFLAQKRLFMRERKVTQEESSGAEASNSMVMIVAVLVGILGTVALGLVLAVVVLGRRRRYAAVNKGAQLIVAEEM